jgi:ribosomal protein L21
MYAVILTGGRQYRVMQGEVLRVEKLEAEPDSAITFDKVLLVGAGDTVVRLVPPLTIGDSEITEMFERLDRACARVEASQSAARPSAAE